MIKRRFFLGILVATLQVSVATAANSRVDFRSSPKGAKVIVDGVVRGQTPLRLFDVREGEHHASVLLANHEPADLFFSLEEGSYSSQYAELVPVKGLLLMTSEPSGCDITLDGISLGTTPRLITSLDAANKYRLLLQKPGYQPRQVEVKFDGRTPLVKKETLILDSGTLQITSDPIGAAVTVNGIPRGNTPLLVKRIPKGRATVALSLDGYAEAVREFTLNAGESQTVFIRMDGLPGTLKVSTLPETARIYVDDVAQDKGSCVLTGLKPGNYMVRAELEGYGTIEKSITVGNGQTVVEELRLMNVMGGLEIRTSPCGVKVYLDGRYCGLSRSSDPTAVLSDLLSVSNIKEGEHTLLAKANGYAEYARTIKVEPSKATQVKIVMRRIFIPDIEIETDSGTYRGILLDQDESSVQIEVALGVTRSFSRETIRKLTMLTNEKEKAGSTK